MKHVLPTRRGSSIIQWAYNVDRIWKWRWKGDLLWAHIKVLHASFFLLASQKTPFLRPIRTSMLRYIHNELNYRISLLFTKMFRSTTPHLPLIIFWIRVWFPTISAKMLIYKFMKSIGPRINIIALISIIIIIIIINKNAFLKNRC